MTIWTKVKPLFFAEGFRTVDDGDNVKDECVVFLLPDYDQALKKAKELLHRGYKRVSCDRVQEFNE